MGTLLRRYVQAAGYGVETASPGNLAHVQGGGLVSSAIGEFLSRATNRYTAFSKSAPALVALEDGILRWACALFQLPHQSMGIITTGASMASLSAVTAAREFHLKDDYRCGTAYVTEQTHPAMIKAARVAGILPDRIRRVATTRDLRMDVDAAGQAVRQDVARGLRPFLLIGTAGTTNTGTIDPLEPLAALARQHGMWFHVDAAYGGFFALTQRGWSLMAGIEQADSICVDPHKSLFLPFGTGILLVRDAWTLREPFSVEADCLCDVRQDDGLVDYADHGPELTREFRGLRLWLPLHLHGVQAFREALDEKLDLAAYACARLRDIPMIEEVYAAELSTVAFRVRDTDDAGHATVLQRINTQGRIQLSSTRVHDRTVLRLCVMSHRTHRSHVNEALDLIRATLTHTGLAPRVPQTQKASEQSRAETSRELG
ncbi:pyridoxal phosphate-dependent decarboxylase family protein [Streptomyces sp. NPDC127068]|uniref:pyridoxal phosphate-dependent decarboxylase family protein n=1 Tax=Streptomyces sp. NPDC127068 TaxID=3347127 RepID=UPI003657D237